MLQSDSGSKQQQIDYHINACWRRLRDPTSAGHNIGHNFFNNSVVEAHIFNVMPYYIYCSIEILCCAAGSGHRDKVANRATSAPLGRVYLHYDNQMEVGNCYQKCIQNRVSCHIVVLLLAWCRAQHLNNTHLFWLNHQPDQRISCPFTLHMEWTSNCNWRSARSVKKH